MCGGTATVVTQEAWSCSCGCRGTGTGLAQGHANTSPMSRRVFPSLTGKSLVVEGVPAMIIASPGIEAQTQHKLLHDDGI